MHSFLLSLLQLIWMVKLWVTAMTHMTSLRFESSLQYYSAEITFLSNIGVKNIRKQSTIFSYI